MNFLNEVLQHSLCHLKVSYNPVFERSNGSDIAGSPAQHSLGINTYSGDIFLVVAIANRDDRRFIQYDTLLSNIDQGISRPKVNGKVIRKHASQALKHLTQASIDHGA